MDVKPLPKFGAPPVTEVALGAYFQPVPLHAQHLGLLWARWRDRYPVAEEQPGLPPAQPEFFGPSPSFAFNVMLGAAPARVWYRAPGTGALVQVQQDRLVHNWRRGDQASATYPHFASIRPDFERDLSEFDAFLSEENVGAMHVTQVEVTYVNVIPFSEPPDMKRVLRPWAGSPSSFAEEEDANFAMRFRIPSSNGEPIGRLHVTAGVNTQRGPDGETSYPILLQVFARGRPLGEGVTGVLAFLDLGHEWIVRGFDALTTSEMHKVWLKEEE